MPGNPGLHCPNPFGIAGQATRHATAWIAVAYEATLGLQQLEILLHAAPTMRDDILRSFGSEEEEPAGNGAALGGVPTAWLRGEMASYARDMIRLLPPEADIRRHHFDAEAYLAQRQVFLNEKSTYISALLRHRVYSRIMTSRLLQLYPKFAAAQVGVDQAIIALALERYRRERGEFPESLSALVPRWLAADPPDVFSGQPIPYKRLAADSYRLESTGAEFWLMLSRRVTGVGWVWEWPVKSP